MTTNGLYGGGNDNGINGFSRSGLRSSGGLAADPAVGWYFGRKVTLELSYHTTIGRKVDSLEQRLSQQDSANRGILEQLMKVQQDFKVIMGTGL